MICISLEKQRPPKFFKSIFQTVYKVVNVKWNALNLSDPPKDLHANEYSADHQHERW